MTKGSPDSRGTHKSEVAIKATRAQGPRVKRELVAPCEVPARVAEGASARASEEQLRGSEVPDDEADDELKRQNCGVEPATEEIEPIRIAKTPAKPDEATVAEHKKTHIPYRSWCSECVEGRGLGEQRGRHAGRSHTIPRVGVDFWFITAGCLKKRDELEFAESEEGEAQLNEARRQGVVMKCLIIRCYDTQCLFAHAIPSKGVDEDKFTVNLVVSAVPGPCQGHPQERR